MANHWLLSLGEWLLLQEEVAQTQLFAGYIHLCTDNHESMDSPENFDPEVDLVYHFSD